MRERIRRLNDSPEWPDRRYVLYWMQTSRRTESNHALAYSIELANRYDLPVLVYEGLTSTYRQATDRVHTFLLEGVPETARRLREEPASATSFTFDETPPSRTTLCTNSPPRPPP